MSTGSSQNNRLANTKERDFSIGLDNHGFRYYDPEVGRYISPDPERYDEGINLYNYVDADPVNSFDPLGLGKASIVGWIVERVGPRLIKVASLFTHKQAAKMFTKGCNVMMKNGYDSAKKVANLCITKSQQLAHRGGHILKDGSRGLPHIQDDKKPGNHIFYGALAAALSYGVVSGEEGQKKSKDIVMNEVYTDARPGQSVAHALTVSHWAGKDSYLGLLDWVNPGELIAMGGDFGRWLEREAKKELIGYTATLRENEAPRYTIAVDPEGKPVSVAQWEDGKLGEPMAYDEFVKDKERRDRLTVLLKDVAKAGAEESPPVKDDAATMNE